MSLKMKQIIKNIIKISTLSLMFILWFFIINTFATVETNQKVETIPNNNTNYKNVIIKPLANVWVAITSNIWLWINKTTQLSESNINNNVFQISDFYSNTNNIKDWIIKTNIVFTKEYLNIIRMDFNWIIKESNDKAKTLNNIIKQLEIRYTNANINLITLNKQKLVLLVEYEKINIQIETLKLNLEKDFQDSKSDDVFNHIDNYYELKKKETVLKTNIIFINEFIKRYNYLNNYNKLLLDTLINNKDVISKNSYIVIPDSGDQLLRSFDLIFTETEYKNK